MSGFDPAWLALREPADHAARDPALLAEAAALAAGGPVADLGCGTGSTLRAMAGLLPGGGRWRLVDHDPVLLAEARRLAPPGALVETARADLADLGPGGAVARSLAGASLATASALLDLVSPAWLKAFADLLAAARLPLYAALTYDGRAEWWPAHPLDAGMTRALNEHQARDKGTGPALGPGAAPAAAELLRARGHRVRLAPSPWRLGPGEAALQAALAEGFAAAARDLGAFPEADLVGWLAFRREAAARGRAEIGHLDLLAVPGA